MAEKVLVVEDEPTLVQTLSYNLQRQGYRVITATDGRSAVEIARNQHPDLMILDLMLPEIDGIEVCRLVRQDMAIPIIMLTAKDEEIDKVVGLEVGADDYLTKPFSMRELMARVKAHLRRVRLTREEVGAERELTVDKKRLVYENLIIDLERHEVLKDGVSLTLTPKEFELLAFLAQNQGVVLSRDLILEKVWGWDFAGGTRTVDVHIRGLREKIETDAAQPRRLVTVRGAGYRFEPNLLGGG